MTSCPDKFILQQIVKLFATLNLQLFNITISSQQKTNQLVLCAERVASEMTGLYEQRSLLVWKSFAFELKF